MTTMAVDNEVGERKKPKKLKRENASHHSAGHNELHEKPPKRIKQVHKHKHKQDSITTKLEDTTKQERSTRPNLTSTPPKTPEPPGPPWKSSVAKLNYEKNKLNFMPPATKETIRHLGAFGAPLEESLAVVVRNSSEWCEVGTGELLRRAEAWKRADREHLEWMVRFLERGGVVPLGAVEVPKGEFKRDETKVKVKVEVDNGGLVSIKEEEV